MNSIRQRRRRQRKIRNAVIVITGTAAVLALAYVAVSLYFGTHFLLRTEINGIGVGGMTAEEAETAIAEDAGDYTLIIVDRDQRLYTIEGSQIDAEYKPDGAVKEALLQQNARNWIGAVFAGNRISVNTPMNYDMEKLTAAVAALSCFDEANIVEPQNAYITEEDGIYQVVEETQGNRMILEKAAAEVAAAVAAGAGEVYLTDEVYVEPEVTSESPEITGPMQRIETCYSARIVYQIADYDETLEGETLWDMILVDEEYNVTLDEDAIARFVQQLATKYNTYGDERNFKTTKGDTIVIGGGDYGWVIDKEGEAELLAENIMAGGLTEREPVYSQRAKVEGLDDIGDTYLEIDYTNQHLWYYEEGRLMMDTDIVSGNISNGNGSPDGLFKVVYKQSPAVLVGEDYESDVEYFIVFAYNVGVHDASWRSSFGGSTYKTSGSHGCVNVPLSAVEELYGMIEKDTPVIAYYREEVQLSSVSADVSNAYSYVEPVEEEPSLTPGDTAGDAAADNAAADNTAADNTAGDAGADNTAADNAAADNTAGDVGADNAAADNTAGDAGAE